MKKVEVAIDINCQPYRVIQAFTDVDMLHEWWNVDRALIDKHSGGLYTLTWDISDQGFGYISTGIIKNFDPQGMLDIDHLIYLNPGRALLGPMRLTIRVTAIGSGCSLYLCQDGYQSGFDWDWYYDAVRESWPVVIKTLKDYLERNAF